MAVSLTVGETLIIILLVALLVTAWAGAACGLVDYVLGSRRP